MTFGDNTDLRGYDMVVSLNQEEVYAGIENVFADMNSKVPKNPSWIIPANQANYDKATDAVKKKQPRIEVDEWFAPYPVFQDSDAANSTVTVYFLIKHGFVFYWAPKPDDPSSNQPFYYPLDNWAIKFDINMNLLEDKKTYGTNTPQSVLDQLENFDESMFKVNTLLMDFNNVQLMENTWEFMAPCGFDPNSISKNKNIPESIQSFNPMTGAPVSTPVKLGDWGKDNKNNIVDIELTNILKNFLAKLKTSDSPYLFGYTANSTNQPTVETASFVPTGTNFSTTKVQADTYDKGNTIDCLTFPMQGTSAKPNPGNTNTINYLLMTNNTPVSNGGDGIYKNSWVKPGQKGAMVISELLIQKLIAQNVVESDNNFSMGDFKPGTYKKDQSDTTETGQPSLYAIIDYTDGKNFNDAKLRCDIVITGNSMEANIYFQAIGEVPLKLWANILGGVTVDTVTATITQRVKIVFNNPAPDGSNDDPVITSTTTIYDAEASYPTSAVQTIEKIGISALDAATGDVLDAFKTLMNAINGKLDFNNGFDKKLGKGLNDLHAKIILPAGREFFFQNAKFAPSRMLVVDLAYKNVST